MTGMPSSALGIKAPQQVSENHLVHTAAAGFGTGTGQGPYLPKAAIPLGKSDVSAASGRKT